ncbi:MAG: glucose-1-phosphate adenylyltransferase [Chloroflexi bacterium]|nr:glucose-1-phosphate adenylyltransferase [Chloroflexota bacterium]
MNNLVALILAGGQGERLSILSQERAKPAVIFAGRYRIIDFTLSNCVNSGIFRVGVLTQYRPRSLNDHIGIGRPWDLDRAGGGIFLLQPYTGRGASDWYRGTADAVYQNLYFLEEQRADLVVVLAGDHVYSMRYDHMVAFHRSVGADVTVGVVEVPRSEVGRYGTVVLDEENRVRTFEEKVAHAQSNLASMGIYVFNLDALRERLIEDAHRKSNHDFGQDILPVMVERDKVYGYKFEGYWRDVGTLEAYWQANMDLLAELPEFNLYDRANPVLTRVANYPPAKVGAQAHVSRSLVCEGCIVDGYIDHSILSPGVHVEEGAVVRDSIIFDDVYIERGAIVDRCIVDKEVRIGHGSQLGWGDDYTLNRQEPKNLCTGLTLVGKRSVLPSGLRVGRNCKVGPLAYASDFENHSVPSGATVEGARGMRRLL